jgi:hypothetical protein
MTSLKIDKLNFPNIPIDLSYIVKFLSIDVREKDF